MFECVAFDVETTGTVAKQDAILEIGAARFINGRLEESFEILIDPKRSVPPEATRINGISTAMVRGQSSVEAALEKFARFCGNAILVAHNANFDHRFLSAASLSVHVPLSTHPIFDSYEIAKKILPQLFNHRLESLVRHFGLGNSGFHRARQDAVYCGQVFMKLLAQYKREHGSIPWGNIQALSGNPLSFPAIEPKARQMELWGA